MFKNDTSPLAQCRSHLLFNLVLHHDATSRAEMRFSRRFNVIRYPASGTAPGRKLAHLDLLPVIDDEAGRHVIDKAAQDDGSAPLLRTGQPIRRKEAGESVGEHAGREGWRSFCRAGQMYCAFAGCGVDGSAIAALPGLALAVLRPGAMKTDAPGRERRDE